MIVRDIFPMLVRANFRFGRMCCKCDEMRTYKHNKSNLKGIIS